MTIDEIRLQTNIPATMRDGTVLRADVYCPSGSEPVPVIVMRHPYSKSRTPRLRDVDIIKVVQSGYILVFQDVRGRFTSDGSFEPSLHEEEDGADTVRWAARLPGSDGRVGMWGSSYGAETQWSAALGGPDELLSIVSINPPSHSQFNGFLMRRGVHEFGSRLNWAHGSIALEELRRASEGADLKELVREYAVSQKKFDTREIYGLRPFSKIHEEVEGFLSLASKTFGEPADAPWRHVSRTHDRYGEIKPQAFIVGGWFDCFLGSTLSQYEGMRSAADAAGKPVPHLLIGPWSHRESADRLGDLSFGPMANAALPGQDEALTGQIIRWFDATLKGRTTPLESLPPVRVFLMGTNRWLGFESFPPAETTTQSWFLGADSTLGTVPAELEGQVSYDYDPTDPVPTVGGPILMAPDFRVGPVAQNELYDRADVVSFTSEPLADPLHAIGPVQAVLHASTSAVDTDFVVTLCDVHPDGRSILIADGIVRVSERDSFTDDGVFRPGARSLVEPGKDLELRVDLLATAHTFVPGHRIRVDVTSSNFPRWDVNLNTGESFYDSDDSVVARQTLKFGGLHKSRIELPVVPGTAVAQASI